MTLDEKRQAIDQIDAAIIALLGQRYAMTDAIGAEKRAQGLPIRDMAREEAVLAKVAAAATKDSTDIIRVFRTLMDTSRQRQARGMAALPSLTVQPFAENASVACLPAEDAKQACGKMVPRPALQTYGTTSAVLDALRTEKATMAVLKAEDYPFYDDDDLYIWRRYKSFVCLGTSPRADASADRTALWLACPAHTDFAQHFLSRIGAMGIKPHVLRLCAPEKGMQVILAELCMAQPEQKMFAYLPVLMADTAAWRLLGCYRVLS